MSSSEPAGDNDAPADRCYMGTWWRATGRRVDGRESSKDRPLPSAKVTASHRTNEFAAQRR